MRSSHGYPHVLAAMLKLDLVDMSCSGTTTAHILHGGGAFLGPQLAAVGPRSRLVTITSGGNDLGFVGYVTKAGRGEANPPKSVLVTVTANFREIVAEIRRRSPHGRIVIAGYPRVLPPNGTCAALGLDPFESEHGRELERGLNEAARTAAAQGGALFVDMLASGQGHDPCSSDPWVYGARPKNGAAF